MLSRAKQDDMLAKDGSERYRELFKVLDQLGWMDLKATFQEHCIEDQTLSFMETEEELKQLLKEIGIPLGKCIPIVKSWSRKNAKKHAPDLTKEVELSSLGSGQRRISLAHTGVQAVKATRDAGTQTEQTAKEDCLSQDMSAANLGTILEELERVRQENQEASMSVYETGMHLNNLGYPCDMTTQPAQLNIPPPGHIFDMSQMQAFSSHGWPAFIGGTDVSDMGNYTHGAQFQSAVPTSSVTVSDMTGTSSGVTAQFEGLGGIGSSVRDGPVTSSGVTEFEELGAVREILPPAKSSSHKEIVDESEDLAIEQSLFEEMEKEQSHSYASALHTKAMMDSEKEEANSLSHLNDKTITSGFTVQSKAASKARAFDKTSQFSKVDDIALQSGTVRKSTSFQNIGSQTLQAYLDSVPESKEYRDAIARYGVKKGWKPIDGKHIYSGKKVQFKPLFCDKELRMRHGVPVRGADKSEECFRHTAGKAPATCTFAHSRLGDTLQFICVKCTCDKARHEWCMDKAKHKQFIFNLGPYKNIDGETWKAVST